ncbi:MAG: 2Fe-2S iron-sulfur cluster-binding protein [Spirochaetota bacterium]|nr:2Fe-2S iron-sulfur cluster-binding protein [Spirochaetota bacterium]
MPKVIIDNKNITVEYNPVISLLNNFNILQVPIGSKCGGRGNCGTCKFKLIEGHKFVTPINKTEKFRLTKEELNEGWRLSCQTHAIRDIKILIPEQEQEILD